MGSGPSKPSDAQLEELRALKPELYRRAAAAIAQADVLLVMTGAGWSADSGLRIDRDIASQPAYAARCLTYPDLCQPHLLTDDPELFYGFWGACLNDYRHTHIPREGYAIVQSWRDELFSDAGRGGAAAPRGCRAGLDARRAGHGGEQSGGVLQLY
jgi:hypothetical protein